MATECVSADRLNAAAARVDPLMLIGDSWTASSSSRLIEVRDPASGDVIGHAPDGDDADVDAAVQAARRSFDKKTWRGKSAEQRARILWRLSDLIERDQAELRTLEVRTNGMPGIFADWMISASVGWLRHFAAQALQITGKNASGAISSAWRSGLDRTLEWSDWILYLESGSCLGRRL
jgi:acyl-CoA reductase-like NAD-dependent aldehyde dehydrogenase